MFQRLTQPNEPFDIATVGWMADTLDPANFLGVGLDARGIGSPESANYSRFADTKWVRQLDAAARLSGPARYPTYSRLATAISREVPPWVVYGHGTAEDFFSSRIGCHVYQPLYGIDLAALCLRQR